MQGKHAWCLADPLGNSDMIPAGVMLDIDRNFVFLLEQYVETDQIRSGIGLKLLQKKNEKIMLGILVGKQSCKKIKISDSVIKI